MANSKAQRLLLLLLLFLLLLVLAVVISSAAAAAAAAAPDVDGSFEDEEKFDQFLEPGTSISRCWKSVVGIEGCAKDVLTSFLTLRIKLSPVCCDAIRGVEEKCFFNIFANPPFDPFFPPLLKGFCSQKADAEGALPPT